MNTWGTHIKITIFGESHGPAIGCVLDGIRPGLPLDEEYILAEMKRRAPGRDELSTARTEADIPRILSGVKEGVSTGAPIACIIENTDQHSSDYDTILRPSHADWTSRIKYGPAADMVGGGRFSGRLTAPLVFAGAICKCALKTAGIRIYGRISGIAGEYDGINLASEKTNENISAIERELAQISAKAFPAADGFEERFKELIHAAKQEGDSVGGAIEVAVFGETAGLGEPFFGSIESTLASLYFSVPAVKSVEWGIGSYLTSLRGSVANDQLRLECRGDSKHVVSITNNNGGVLGGIANGMPIFASVAIKPTASIAGKQDVVDYGSSEMTEVRASVRGRHDPCIVPRAVPVMEAATAIGLLDLLIASGNASL